MASASGGQNQPVCFELKLLVSYKHMNLDNLRVIQRLLQQNIDKLRKFLNEKHASVCLKNTTLNTATSSQSPVILLEFEVTSVEELEDMKRIISGSKLASTFSRFAIDEEIHEYINPQYGLKFFINLPNEVFSEVKAQLPKLEHTRDQYGHIHKDNQADEGDFPEAHSSDDNQKTWMKKDVNKESHDLGPKQKQQTKENDIRISFVIFVPNVEDHYIGEVKISCKDLPSLDGEIMKKKCKKLDLYYCEVDLPISVMDQGLKYRYQVRHSSYTWTYRFSSDCLFSGEYTLDSAPVQRNLWGGFEFESVDEHLDSIIFYGHEQFKDLKDRIIQIESFIEKIHPNFSSFQKLTQLFSERLHDHHKKEAVLCLVVIGHISQKCKYSISNSMMKQQKALLMLTRINQYKQTDFPSSCKTYLPSVCRDLCNVIDGSQSSILTTMVKCQPFLDECLFNRWIQESNKKELALTGDCNIIAANKLAEYALRKIKEQSRTDTVNHETETFLRNLMNHCALPYKICKCLDSNSSSKEQSLLQEAVEILLYKLFIAAETLDVTEYFVKLWDIISSRDFMFDKFRGMVEEKIIKLLQSGKCLGLVYKVTALDRLFDTEEMQVKFLKEIAVSGNAEVHSSFHQAIKLAKIKDCLHEGNFYIFNSWFNTMVDTHLRYKKFGKVATMYKRTFEVLSAVEMNIKESVVQALGASVYSYISTLRITDVLVCLRDVESVCEEQSYLSMCEDHLKRLLKTQARQLSMKDILKSFGLSKRTLTIDSRLVAIAICFLLEDRSPILDTDSELVCLEKMTTAKDVWEPIFSCSGKHSDDIKNCLTYKRGQQAVEMFLEKLHKFKIPYEVLIKEDNLLMKKLLLKGSGETDLNRKTIDSLWMKNMSTLEKQKKDLTNLYSVVSTIMDHIEDGRPEVFDSFYEQLCYLVTNFDKMDPLDMQSNFFDIYIYHQNIFKQCSISSEIIKSKVYWNLYKMNLDPADIISDLTDSVDNEEKILSDICRLFEEISLENQTNNKLCCRFVCSVLENGSRVYLKEWMNLQENPGIKITHVFSMFGGCFPNIDEEIAFAEAYLRQKISYSCQKTLKRLSKLEKMIGTVDAMESTLKAFNVDLKTDPDFDEAISSFRKLLHDKKLDLSFQEVSSHLGTVYEVSEKWNDTTLNILKVVGKASSLIHFLTDIMNDDIRNLIDAVEDISEQHVSESTVSALIEAKGFFKPLLNSSHGKCVDVLDDVHKQVKKFGENAEMLPSKIDDCMDNLHNLKSLYNNVANRGEQTKQVIQNIVKQGKFHFQLDTKYKCCEFTVTYTQQKTKQKVKHTKAALSDFRSRALLLMNSERQSKNIHDLEDFVQAIDRCLDISENIYQLYSAGHWKYPNFEKTESFKQLHDLNNSLRKDLENWNQHHREMRKKHYLLNFIQGLHIHVLYRYLEKHENDEMMAIVLRFIHPELNPLDLKNCYDQMKTKSSKFDFLSLVGEAITFCHSKLKSFSRLIEARDDREKRITEIVKSGRVQIVHLEEDTAIKTLLALYLQTSSRLPEPSEVLLCTRDTTWNEIELLLGRCLGAYEFFEADTLFCIANVELLSNEIHFKLVDVLKNIDKKSEYLLAIICKGSANQPFLDEFYENVTKVRPLTDETVKMIFEEVCPDMCTYTSDCAGLGKSTTILSTAKKRKRLVKSVHVSGKIQKQKLIERCQRMRVKRSELLHIDIGYIDHHLELDTFLFELIILGFTAAEGSVIDLKTTHICIEIANTINNTLRNSLQTAVLFKRHHLKWHKHENFVVSKEVNSPVQIVCQYLFCLDKGKIDKCDLVFSGEECVKPLSTKVCRYLLQKYFEASDTFTATNICIRVLADQLKKMSNSTFFKISRIRDMIGNKTIPIVKSSMVKALLEVTKELASRSVDAYRNTQQNTLTSESVIDDSHYKVDLAVAASKHTEHMIRWDDSNHLIYVFHNQNIQTISPMYRLKSLVPGNIKDLFESQMKRPLSDYQTLSPNELQDILQKVVRINPTSLPKAQLAELASSYALTPDNLLKMVLIILHIKSRVPVLVMGETGCGKTSLIRYLATICEVDFDVVSIHAGVEERIIVKKVLENNEAALRKLDQERWLFLDEINTSEYIGLISDMICHHRCFGKLLSPNLIILSACNPYKLRSTKSIFTSGLKGKIKTDELSRLVYRVLPLPEMLVDYVWDFGSLTPKDEKIYIDRMVAGVFSEKHTHELFVDLLAMSQTFARSVEETTSSVSLRDIYRCKILTEWFLETLLKKRPKKEMTYKSRVYNDTKIPAIILSLSHCYICRFSEKENRKSYLAEFEKICKHYHKDVYTPGLIEEIIRQEQQDILSRMELPSGTAQNSALRENVFVILVCILNRIPIFVVGKPGCSKSLSLQVIKSNLRGKDSKDQFFQTLPQLYCVSFQGSESSTSDGIIKVFEKAEKYQEANNKDDVLSVVILDEIGLAEVSRFNPLKVLHNLLEPDGLSRPNVAVVGVSNWSLDASKMNRAIHLSRPDMDVEELFETAKSISESFEKEEKIAFIKEMEKNRYSFKTSDIEKELNILAHSYMSYMLAIRFENFHGLRDYYSLVKYIANELSICQKSPAKEKIISVIARGLERNFGGLPTEKELLRKKFQMKSIESSLVLELVKDNVKDPLARHLMIITTGDSILGIIDRSLTEAGREKKEILFGSQFEEDLTDDYNYRMLSRIILCMEQGIVLVLKNLENIYGSLYDLLNKNYSEIGSKKHCRVALGAYSNPICHVHDDFRCIVIVNDRDVDYTDPPFLNRFEKQIVNFSDVICKEQTEIINKIEKWLSSVCQIEGRNFEKENCFPIYSKDMIASYVFHKNIEQLQDLVSVKSDLLWVIKPECIVRLPRALEESTRIEAKWLQDKYFSLPLHFGISELIKSEKSKDKNLMLIIFTNTSIHSRCLFEISGEKQIEKLGSFKSEKQLSSRIKKFWLQSSSEFLFVQCSAVDDEKHIMLCKSIIERNRLDYLLSKPSHSEKHVCLIIHLDTKKNRSQSVSQINFLSGWKLVMLDSLEAPSTPLPDLHKLSLYDAVMSKRPLNDYVSEQLFWAFTRIKFGRYGRDVDSIETVLKQMKHSENFIQVLEERVCEWISKTNIGMSNTEWQESVACDPQALETSLTFADALDKHIMHVINVPLSKLIFQLEKMGLVDSYFIEDEIQTDRRQAWLTQFSNEKVFNIEGIHDENGPETFECNTHDLSLKMPFSLYIFNTIESTCEEYLKSLVTLKQLCNLEEDEDLPPEILDKLEIKQRHIISQRLHVDEFVYSGWIHDYIDDFCNIAICKGYNALDKQNRVNIMKWIIQQNHKADESCALKFVTSLHIVYWRFSDVFHNVLQLFSVCQKDVLFEKSKFDLMTIILDELNDQQDDNTKKKGEEIANEKEFSELYNRTKIEEEMEVSNSFEFNVSKEQERADNDSVLKGMRRMSFDKNLDPEKTSSQVNLSNPDSIQKNKIFNKCVKLTHADTESILVKNGEMGDKTTEKTSDECSSNSSVSELQDRELICSDLELQTEDDLVSKDSLVNLETMKNSLMESKYTLIEKETEKAKEDGIVEDKDESIELWIRKSEEIGMPGDNERLDKQEMEITKKDAISEDIWAGAHTDKDDLSENLEIDLEINNTDKEGVSEQKHRLVEKELDELSEDNDELDEQETLKYSPSDYKNEMIKQGMTNIDNACHSKDNIGLVQNEIGKHDIIEKKDGFAENSRSDDSVVLVREQTINIDADYVLPDIADSHLQVNEMQPLDRMVHVLCNNMLPTKYVLQLYGGLENWHLKVNTMLRLAANISDHVPILHSLRYCNDISTELLHQNQHDCPKLETVAQVMKSGEALDSSRIFEQLMEILIDLKSEDTGFQQLLSTYLMRCLAMNSETKAFNFLLEALMKGKVSCTKITFVKLPFSTAIASELDASIYVDLIYNPNDFGDLPLIFTTLNDCLKHLYEDCSSSSELFSLIIDILEEKYQEVLEDELEETNDKVNLFLKSHSVLKEEFGVSFLAAVAYCKVYMSQYIMADGEYTEECLVAVLPCFQFIDEEYIDLFLCKLFLKSFGKSEPLAKVWIFFNSLKERYPAFSKLNWDEKDIQQCFEMCPLKVYSIQAFEESLKVLVSMEETNLENLKDLMDKGKECANNLLGIYGAATQYFYFQGFYSRITDTKGMQASFLVDASTCLGKESLCLLKCIVGKQDFDVAEFQIHQGSSSTDFYLSSILISLYCLLLAEFESSDKVHIPILTRCLLKPAVLKQHFLPGMQKTRKLMAWDQVLFEKFRFHTCKFNLRLCAMKEVICEFCAEEISEEKQVKGLLSEDIKEPLKGYIQDTFEDTVCTDLSPVVYHMLNFLTKGCIIGAVALGQATSKDLEEIGLPENGIYHLWAKIEEHWEYTLGALDVSEHTLSLIFHALFYKARDFLCKDTTEMLEHSERNAWEAQFKVIVEEILSSRFITIQDLFAKHMTENTNTLEGELRELCDNHKRLTNMLRFKGEMSMDNFYFEFERYKERYSFLDFVLKSYEELTQPRHIVPIVQWHLLVVSSVSYVMRRDECLKMTVNDFLHLTQDKGQRDLRRKRFDAFKKSWETVFKLLKDETLSSKKIHMHGQTKMSDCLILDEKSVLYEVLLKLTNIQNDFLDASLALARISKSVKFLCHGPNTSSIKCIDLGNITVKHLIDFDETLEEFISDYTQSDLTYGCGQHIIYNFASIEKALAVKLLNSKAYINMKDSLPRIIFSDEFYKNFAMLVSDLCGIVEQKPLPKSLKDAINANHEKDPKMVTELIKHLGVIMALMKKTTGEPEMALIEYTDKWSSIMTHSLPHEYLPMPANSIKLTHVIALHEFLEELNANSILDSLEEEFRQGLDVDIESHLSNFVQEKFKLAEIALGTIKRFVFRCLSARDADSKQQLSIYIINKSFWPVDLVEDGVINFGEERLPVSTIIPDGLMVSHIHATFTFLESEIQEKAQNDLNMSGMAIFFDTSDVANKVAKSKPKRKQKLAKKKQNF